MVKKLISILSITVTAYGILYAARGQFDGNYKRGNQVFYVRMDNPGTAPVNYSTSAVVWAAEGSGNSWVSGKFEQALSVNGSGGLVTAERTAFQVQNYTILAWIRPGASQSGRHVLIVQAQVNDWTFELNNDFLRMTETVSGVSKSVQALTKISSSTWTCVAGRRINNDPKGYTLFQNGVKLATAAPTNNLSPFFDENDDVEIGCNAGGANLQFIGRIDSMMMYNIALTDGEIAKQCGRGVQVLTEDR